MFSCIYVALVSGLLTMLPTTSGYISCQTACRKCKQELDIMKLVEVYCAMCRECTLRRSERRNMGDDAVGSMEGEDYVKTELPIEQPIEELPPDTLENDNGEGVSVVDVSTPDNWLLDKEMVLDERPVMPLAQTTLFPVHRVDHHAEDQYESYKYNRGHQSGDLPLEIPPGCPLPPYCDELDDDEEIIIKLKSTTRREPTTRRITTTSTTTTTTTRPPCPNIKCRIRKKKIWWNHGQIDPQMMPMCPMSPCAMAMPCPLPMPGCPTPNTNSGQAAHSTPDHSSPHQSTPATTTSEKPSEKPSDKPLRTDGTTDFMYIYVGIPKEGK